MDESELISHWIRDALGFLNGHHPAQFDEGSDQLAKLAECHGLDSTPITKAGRAIEFFSDKPIVLDMPDMLPPSVNAQFAPMVYEPKESDYTDDVFAAVDVARRLLVRCKADTDGGIPPKIPDSPDVADFCRELQKVPSNRRKRGWIIATARKFKRHDEKAAKNLARQARRYRHLY